MNESILAGAGLLILAFLGGTLVAWTLLITRWIQAGRFPFPGRDRRPAPWGIAIATLLLFAAFATNIATAVHIQTIYSLDKKSDSGVGNIPAPSATAHPDFDSEIPAERPIEELIDEAFRAPTTELLPLPTPDSITDDEVENARVRNARTDHARTDDTRIKDPPETPQHPVIEAMQNDPALAPMMFFVAVVAAPVGEEILFRLLLLGGLEATLCRFLAARRIPLRRLYPIGVALSVVLVAAIFAALHFRSGAASPEAPLPWQLLVIPSTVMLLASVAALVVLRIAFGATLADFGLDPGPGGRLWRQDVRTGLIAAMLVIVPLLVIQGTLMLVIQQLDWSIAPDPFTIFPLALVLGFIFMRTRRLLPCIVLHFCLNAISMSLALLGTLQH